MASNVESDEDDYMSDALLTKCDDVRPGLARPGSKLELKRQRIGKEPKKEPVKKQKTLTELRTENRSEGLDRPLTAENKGFAMLQKMGFKPGMSLGKTDTGIKEPVRITLPKGRTGVGHAAHAIVKQKEANVRRAWQTLQRQNMEATFRERCSERRQEEQAEKDLYISQKACAQLDEQQDIREPSESFFWPDKRVVEEQDEALESESGFTSEAYEEEEEEEEVEEQQQQQQEEPKEEPSPEDQLELTAIDKLEVLTLYLRNTYYYCIWCGTAYNDKTDLKQNCPGNTKQDHDDY